MSAMRFSSSKSDPWTQPRPHHDASLRMMMHGKIQPMEAEKSRSIFSLFRWR